MGNQSFGQWLKRKRKDLDLTQAALADQVGCSAAAIRKIEAEERRPSAQIVERFAQIFEIPDQEQEDFLRFARGGWGNFPQTGHVQPSHDSKLSTSLHLPASVNSFIGREKEITDVYDYLQKVNTRLVTLVGPPGIGKTRLSLEVSRRMTTQFIDGIFFIALAPIEDPALVASVIVEGLGYVDARNQQPLEHLIQVIGRKCILLVLDNCEHVINDVASLVSGLLSSCSRLKILTTSRESLRVPGETLYLPSTLSAPIEYSQLDVETAHQYPALVLFEERAHAVRAGFSLTDENVQAVAAICARLDGLPLAIELLATRIRFMSPQTLLEHMTDAFILSTDGMRSISARQKTLSNAIRWSYDSLPEAEKKLFQYLSVFGGGFLLETVEMIFSEMFPDILVNDLVLSLSDKSLLRQTQQRDGEIRFGMLVTIQQFAMEQLRSNGEEKNARGLHIQYFLRFSERAGRELIGPQQAEWSVRIIEERDNLRAALRWAVRHDVEAGMYLVSNIGFRFWENFNMPEGVHWLAQLLHNPESHSFPIARVKALCIQGFLQFHFQQFDLQRAIAEESLALSRAVGDPQSECDSLNTLGSAMQFLEGMKQKADLQEHALVVARSIGDIWRQAESLAGLSWDQRDPPKALACRKEAIELYRKAGDWQGLAFLLSLLANDVIRNGDIEYAQQLLDEVSTLNRQTNDKRSMEFLLVAQGNIALLRGDNEQARSFMLQNLENLQELGNRMGYLWARARLGYISLREGDRDAARKIFIECTREFRQDGNRAGLIFALELMATLLIQTNNPERAARLIGWKDETQRSTGNSAEYMVQEDRDLNMDGLHTKLSDAEFRSMYEEGCAMTVEEIVAYALEE